DVDDVLEVDARLRCDVARVDLADAAGAEKCDVSHAVPLQLLNRVSLVTVAWDERQRIPGSSNRRDVPGFALRAQPRLRLFQHPFVHRIVPEMPLAPRAGPPRMEE